MIEACFEREQEEKGGWDCGFGAVGLSVEVVRVRVRRHGWRWGEEVG